MPTDPRRRLRWQATGGVAPPSKPSSLLSRPTNPTPHTLHPSASAFERQAAGSDTGCDAAPAQPIHDLHLREHTEA